MHFQSTSNFNSSSMKNRSKIDKDNIFDDAFSENKVQLSTLPCQQARTDVHNQICILPLYNSQMKFTTTVPSYPVRHLIMKITKQNSLYLNL